MLRVTKLDSGKAGILLGMMLDCHRDNLVQCLPCWDPSQGLWKAQGKAAGGAQQKGLQGPNCSIGQRGGCMETGTCVHVCEQPSNIGNLWARTHMCAHANTHGSWAATQKAVPPGGEVAMRHLHA